MAAAASLSIGHFIKEYETQQSKKIIITVVKVDSLGIFIIYIYYSLRQSKNIHNKGKAYGVYKTSRGLGKYNSSR